MTRTFCDANVALKWFHGVREQEVAEARAMAIAAGEGRIELRVLDLTYFEIGNALARKLRWTADDVSAALSRIAEITGEPIRLNLRELFLSGQLAVEHQLSFYDSAYWAAALSRDATLVTMDAALLDARAGETPAQLCERLGLGVD